MKSKYTKDIIINGYSHFINFVLIFVSQLLDFFSQTEPSLPPLSTSSTL